MKLQHLKNIAAKLSFQHHHNIGVDKLEAQLRDYCTNNSIDFEAVYEETVAGSADLSALAATLENTTDTKMEDVTEKLKNLTFAQAEGEKLKKNAEQRTRDAMKLIRCTITTNNKNKTSYQGEIFSVRNKKIGEVKKFIPFGVPTHVPQILLNTIKERDYQSFRKERVNGNMITRPYMIKEYNVQMLDPLTAEDLEAIRKKQLAEGSIGN